jgi:hypothetical protein
MANKTVPTQISFSQYLETLADERRRDEARQLATLMSELSGEKPVMWGPSIVGFGSYHYRYESGRSGDMCRIGFSPRMPDFVIYICGGFDRHEDALARLGKHRVGKSCLYLKRLSDAEPTVLREILTNELAYMDTTYPRS